MGSYPGLRSNPNLREQLRNRARLLKAQGDSISVICDTLGVAQSTVGGWVAGMNEEPAMVKYCEFCGDAFLARRRDARFCQPGVCPASRRVATKQPPPEPKMCLHCGARIVNRPRNAKFCCSEHLREYHAAKRAAPEVMECKWCGVWFKRKGAQRYCCPEHKNEAHKAARRGQRYVRTCEYCDEPFVTPYPQQRFCSRNHSRRVPRVAVPSVA